MDILFSSLWNFTEYCNLTLAKHLVDKCCAQIEIWTIVIVMWFYSRNVGQNSFHMKKFKDSFFWICLVDRRYF